MVFKPVDTLNKHIDMCGGPSKGHIDYANELGRRLRKNTTLFKDYIESGDRSAATEYIRNTHNELMFDVIDSVQRAYDIKNGNGPEGYEDAFAGLKEINFNNFDYRILLVSQRNDDRIASVGNVWAEAEQRQRRSFNFNSGDGVIRMRQATLTPDTTKCYMPMTMSAAGVVTDVINEQCAAYKNQLNATVRYKSYIDEQAANLHDAVQRQWSKSGLQGIDKNPKLENARGGAKAGTTWDDRIAKSVSDLSL